MSGDELIALIVSAILSAFLWLRWYLPTFRIWRVRPRVRSALVLMPIVALAILYVVLKTLASHDVRDSPLYLTFFVLMGAAWLGVMTSIAGPCLDLHVRDDAIERDNPASAVLAAGALLGFVLAFAGGNIGDGPGWWVVIFSSGLASVAVLLGWGILAGIRGPAGLADAIAVERNVWAAVRLAAWLIAAGLVAGRAAAGTWTSAEQTLIDFAVIGWPLIPLLFIAVLLEFALFRDRNSDAPLSLGAATTYLALAGGWVIHSGVPA